MHISERVRVGVPTPEAQVKTSDASAVIVDNDDLLVMRPELHIVYGTR